MMSRSRSAPPILREQVGKWPPSQSGVSPKIGERNNNESATLPIKVVDKQVD